MKYMRLFYICALAMTTAGCASLSYYSGADFDKEQIKQVLLIHSQSAITGHVPSHMATQTANAIHAGSFTGGSASMRNQAVVHTEQVLHQMSEGTIPPEREIVGKIRFTRFDIKFMRDNVAIAFFREVGFDGMDRNVFQHDVSAYLIKEGREWKVYAMAGGDIIFDREGLEQDWYFAPYEPKYQYGDEIEYEPEQR